MLHKIAISPPPRLPLQLNLHIRLPRLKSLRVNQIINRTGIMSHREIKILFPLVSHLKITEQRNQLTTEIRLQLPQRTKHLLSYQICMSHLQRHHRQSQTRPKHYRRSLRINHNIKFSSPAPVTQTNRSPHNRHPINLLLYILKTFKQNRQISHSPRHHKFDRLRLPHYPSINLQKRFLLYRRIRRLH